MTTSLHPSQRTRFAIVATLPLHDARPIALSPIDSNAAVSVGLSQTYKRFTAVVMPSGTKMPDRPPRYDHFELSWPRNHKPTHLPPESIIGHVVA